MKNVTTGESSGEPLPHDEWVKEQAKAAEKEQKTKDARTNPVAHDVSGDDAEKRGPGRPAKNT